MCRDCDGPLKWDVLECNLRQIFTIVKVIDSRAIDYTVIATGVINKSVSDGREMDYTVSETGLIVSRVIDTKSSIILLSII